MNNELCWDTDRAVVSYLRGLNDSKRVASPQPKSGMGDSSQILKIQSSVITHKQLRRVGSDSSGQLSWSLPLTLLLYRDGLLVHLLAACCLLLACLLFLCSPCYLYKFGKGKSSAYDEFQRAQRYGNCVV